MLQLAGDKPTAHLLSSPDVGIDFFDCSTSIFGNFSIQAWQVVGIARINLDARFENRVQCAAHGETPAYIHPARPPKILIRLCFSRF